MPQFDEKRMIINNVLLTVAEYLRVLAADSQYINKREELLSWADQWELENGGHHEVF